MQFAFTDEQALFSGTVADLLAKECRPEDVRAAWDADHGLPQAWNALESMGLFDPELTALDLALPLEQTGRYALPGPVVETALLGPSLGVSGVMACSLEDGSPVPWAHAADVIAVRRGACLMAVPRSGAVTAPIVSVDGGRRLATVTWPAGVATTLTDDEGAIAWAWDLGAFGTSAQLLGLASHLLATTVDYAKERHQFGAPIGSYQAVKHHLADVLLRLEHARPVVYRAAWSLSRRRPDASLHVSMAKADASDAAELAARTALQVHGAIGYAFESDLHLWMKRVWVLAASWGDAAWHRARVADAVLGPAPLPVTTPPTEPPAAAVPGS